MIGYNGEHCRSCLLAEVRQLYSFMFTDCWSVQKAVHDCGVCTQTGGVYVLWS